MLIAVDATLHALIAIVQIVPIGTNLGLVQVLLSFCDSAQLTFVAGCTDQGCMWAACAKCESANVNYALSK